MTCNIKSLLILLSFMLLSPGAVAFDLQTIEVAKDVYALIGDTGPRTYENHALNNNVGFIVSDEGIILIDSGASPSGAKLIQQKISAVTDKSVKWVINTGSQDHRWLGNSFFTNKGAEIIALKTTVEEQKKHIDNHMDRLKNTLRENSADIKPIHASRVLQDADNKLVLGNKQIELKFLGDSHFPGDSVVWMQKEKVIFTGDLVYVDRMLGIQSYSPVVSWLRAFKKMEQLNPEFIIPGHGSVSSLTKVKKETGDYLEYLITGVSKALEDWKELDETVNALTETAGQFNHLENFESWHKLNVNRTYLQLEAGS